MSARYLVLLHYTEEVEPGHRTQRVHCDRLEEAKREIRGTLAKRATPGEWGVILQARDGYQRARYVVDKRGIVHAC